MRTEDESLARDVVQRVLPRSEKVSRLFLTFVSQLYDPDILGEADVNLHPNQLQSEHLFRILTPTLALHL